MLLMLGTLEYETPSTTLNLHVHFVGEVEAASRANSAPQARAPMSFFGIRSIPKLPERPRP